MRIRAMTLPRRAGSVPGASARYPSTAARDVDGRDWDAERIDDELRVLQAVGARRAIRHSHADHVLGTQRAGGEIGAVTAESTPPDIPTMARVKSAARELIANELDEPLLDEWRIDRQRRRAPTGPCGAR